MSIKHLIRVAAIIAVLVSVQAFAVETNLAPRYYQSGHDVIGAYVNSEDPSVTIYRLQTSVKADTDSAWYYLPIPNGVTNVRVEWVASSSNDSVYVEIRYGALFAVLSADRPIFYDTIQDTLLYWYKASRQLAITTPEELFSSQYFVVSVKGSKKLPATGAVVTVKVSIPKK